MSSDVKKKIIEDSIKNMPGDMTQVFNSLLKNKQDVDLGTSKTYKASNKETDNYQKMRRFGLVMQSFLTQETLEDLKKYPPNMIIVKCLSSAKYSQNRFKKMQEFKKGYEYIMSIGIYDQCSVSMYTGKKILKPSNKKFSKLYKPYNGEDLNGKTILIWRTGGIGDLLFIQPNLYALKEKYPNCKIIFGTGPQYHDMVKEWDCIDKLIALPFNVMKMIRADYHCVFEGVIERCKESEKINAYKLFTKWVGLNLPDDKLIPHQEPNSDILNEIKTIFFSKLDKSILLQLNASSPIRTPNVEVTKNIYQKILDEFPEHNIFIVDSPNNADAIDNLIKPFKNDRLINFARYSETIAYSIALCSIVNGVICVDSSMAHIAASLHIPIVGIYGPFPGKIRLSTYSNCDWIDCQSDEKCAPCFKHGQAPCKNMMQNKSCFNNLDIDELIQKFKCLIT